MTLNLKVKDLVVGEGKLYDVKLVPGNNSMPFRATVFLGTVLENLVPIITNEADSLVSGNLELSASGNSTMYQGHHVEYYEEILNKLLVTAQVPILTLLEGTLGGLLNSSSGTLSSLLSHLNVTELLGMLQGAGNGTGMFESVVND